MSKVQRCGRRKIRARVRSASLQTPMNSNSAKLVEAYPEAEEFPRSLWASPASKLLTLTAQLGLLLLVVDQYQIGGTLFLRILMLAIAGFLLRFALPQRFQLTLFLVLSVIGAVWALGSSRPISETACRPLRPVAEWASGGRAE
jgi:hypothetical protein